MTLVTGGSFLSHWISKSWAVAPQDLTRRQGSCEPLVPFSPPYTTLSHVCFNLKTYSFFFIYWTYFICLLKTFSKPWCKITRSFYYMTINVLIFIIFLNWSRVGLQCCANYCCAAKRFSHIYIYIFTILFYCGLS